ncbi:MAG: 2-C-methyl-D-erythritol 4-phosphate cytidylyltransferase [Spirochaetales bacterium]|nr:2-C-methyl-D-erythritol 4-phosphate cytidylyltransferase [Spirochaetales bacterium]
MRIGGIITAAGESRRIGSGIKKEYFISDGKPVLVKCIEALLVIKELILIGVTVPKGHEERVTRLLKPHCKMDDIFIIEGGLSRQESVYHALEKLDGNSLDYVLIHDGARPWADENLIMRVLEGTRRHKACIPVVDLTDAVKEVNSRGFIKRDLDRNSLRGAQTPQGFDFNSILKAHRKASSHGKPALDDAELYSLYCGPVFTVPGDVNNKKITFKKDLEGL